MTAGLAGWVFVGRKKSGLKLTDEDRELLETLAGESAAALRRVRLQEEVVYERASREKSEQLGRLKTEFISSVSHELRTPMTSLQSISELLQSGKVGDAARRERLLELMAGECGRLGRYLHNVLDFGRIEQDVKLYEIRETDLKPVIADVVEIVRSAVGGRGPRPRGRDAGGAGPGRGRPRFGLSGPAQPRRQRHQVRRAGGSASPSGWPRWRPGRGQRQRQRHRHRGRRPREGIFEAFFRSPEAVRHDPKGVGLGLKIVKHIMDAHGGAVAVESEPGQGTTFTLRFPKRRKP